MTRVIGRIEKISFPELNIIINAKVDTGAYRSALHVDNYEIIDNQLVFTIYNKTYVYNDFKEITVRNSFGGIQKRFYIELKLKIGNKLYRSLVSLTNRQDMKYPCLIGRRFLKSYKFIVDVGKKNINDRS